MNEEKTAYYIGMFDDFLDGKLSEEQIKELKAALTDNSYLNKVLQQQVQLRANIRKEGEKVLKEKFNNSFPPIQPPVPESSNRVNYLLIALLFIVLAFVVYFFFMKKPTTTVIPPIAELEIPSFDLVRTNNPNDSNLSWQEAIDIFFEEEYQDALDKIRSIEDPDFLQNNSGKLALLSGLSQMKLGLFAEARKTFKEIKSSNPYYDQAIWYEALSYYYDGKQIEATTALQSIADNPSHYRNTEAGQYLKAIN